MNVKSILFVFQLLILSLMGTIVIGLDSIRSIYIVALVATLISVAIQLLGKFKTNLLLVWQFAFLYIIDLEGIFHYSEILMRVGNTAITASKYLVITYFISIIGYFIFYLISKSSRVSESNYRTSIYFYEPSFYATAFLLTMYILFIILNYRNAVHAFYGGRSAVIRYQGNIAFLVNTFKSSLSMSLPIIIGFFLKYVYKTKKYILYTILLCLPIFTIQLLLGTRLTLLFSFGSLAIVLLSGLNIKSKNVLLLLIFLFILMFMGQIMVESRGIGFANYLLYHNKSSLGSNFLDLFYTKEGITAAVAMLIDYFQTNSHLYGIQTAYILIFWIPRIFWQSKPTMLGYWLIREINPGGYSTGHSISFGFTGDAFADFGFIGGFIFSFIIGCFIRILERRNKDVETDQYKILYKAVTHPFIFLAMRSFQTSLFIFVYMFLFLMIFKWTLLPKRKVIKK